MEARGNDGRGDRGRGERGGRYRGRGDRGRGDHNRGDRGRGDHNRGDRGRGDHGRGDRGRGGYGRDGSEHFRRPAGEGYTPRGRGGYGSRDRRDESEDRAYKRPRYDDGAGTSSSGGYSRGGSSSPGGYSRGGSSSSGGYSRGGSFRGASSNLGQFSGGWSRGGQTSAASSIAGTSSGGASGGGDSLTMPPGFGNRGRGRGRGRGRMEEVVKCRPENITDTVGSAKQRYSTIVANYFKATSTPNWRVFQYHADFLPEIDDSRLKRAFVHSVREDLGSYIFDGSSLFSIRRLGDSEEYVTHAKRKTDDADITITFKLVKEWSSDDPILLQIFNILLRKCFRYLKLKQSNRNYYDPESAECIAEHNLEVWPGFISSIRRHQSDVLMQIDLSFRFLRTDSVLEQLNNIRRRYPTGYHDEVIRSIVGCTVVTRYNNRMYRIDDIEWEKSPLSTFANKTGSQITFKNYYMEHWNVPITVDSQPLLISRPREKDQARGLQSDILLVPELTFMTGLSEATRTNFQIMRAIATKTRIGPSIRVEKLKQIMSRIQNNQESRTEMGNWNLNFDNNLIRLRGRVLTDEQIVQRNERRVEAPYNYDRRKSDWTNNLRKMYVYTAIDVNHWLLIYSRDYKNETEEFLYALNEVCPPMGIRLSEPTRIALDNDSARTYAAAIQSGVDENVQLVVCVLKNPAKDRYDAIKKVCCIECPIPSQVVTKKVMGPKLMSAATKIGIQINCKVGGAPWAVKMPLKNIMVIGYDAYRDSSRRGTSVGALCCSLDQNLTKYYSRVCFQTGETEMIDGLVENLAAGLKRYKELNGKFPERILFYRDGGSEGQLLSIRDNELSRILDTFKQLEITNPQFAFIVVSKRINTRLMEESKGGKMENPTPGTVVDTVITRNEWYDFYLVSQSVHQGTVSPTHFNIIHDTSRLQPDHMQRLAYKLTHMYYNWPGTVRVPAPCVYAHKLAFLTSQSLHVPHHEKLADKLFFL